MRVLNREPVIVVETITAAVLAVTLFFNFNTEVQGAVTAAVVAIGGFVSAYFVSVERALPMLAGVAKAVIAMLAAFGLDVAPNVQAGVMALITVVVGFWVRGQVIPPAPPAQAAHDATPPVRRSTGGMLRDGS